MKDTKPTPEGSPVRINDLLVRLGLANAFDQTIFKLGEARHMEVGQDAEDFIFSKLDALKAYVTANKTDSTTDEELKTLILDWLADQGKATESC